MPLENLAALVVLLGLIAYAMFGGADFGGGVWTALASGRRAAGQREADFACSRFMSAGRSWAMRIIGFSS